MIFSFSLGFLVCIAPCLLRDLLRGQCGLLLRGENQFVGRGRVIFGEEGE